MKNLILRNTPEIANCFALETIDAVQGKNVFEVEERDGKIVLRGDTVLSQAMAYYHYLKECCHVNLSHCGNTTLHVQEAPLPTAKTRRVVPQEKRAYLNYCTFAYSMAWWDWEKWEKEIDFMAMNGINLPLSVVGSEAVWYYTLRDLGYSEKGALSCLSGPAFWPWQLMTNLDGYFALTELAYIEARVELGKKIIDRQLELGMTPIQQGFSGQVPKNMIRLFPKARFRHVASWNKFKITYQIDPLDPAFAKIGKLYLEKQRQIFGAHHYYACDPFHENEPPVKGKAQALYLQRVGKAFSELFDSFDKQSRWVMQSWSLRESIVKAVPKDKLLILDIGGTRWAETDGFWGYDFVLGRIHNFGDRNSLHGSVKELADNPYLAAREKHENTVGTGLFPEGIYQNPLYYDLAFTMLTQDAPVDLEAWLRDYALRRYGSDEECLADAMLKLRESCYNDACAGKRETGSILCARPSTDWQHTGLNDRNELCYDNETLYEAAQLLLRAKHATTDGYRYDTCDLVRQVLSNYAQTLYHQTIRGHAERDARLFERSSNAFLKIIGEVDNLLLTRPELSLPQQLKAPSLLATSDVDKQNFEINFLSQLTLWGPVDDTSLYDYAWKEWGGMLSSFYLMRWRALFEQLAGDFKSRRPLSTNTKKRPSGRDEYMGGVLQRNLAKFEKNWLATYKPEEPDDDDALELARKYLDKYNNILSV